MLTIVSHIHRAHKIFKLYLAKLKVNFERLDLKQGKTTIKLEHRKKSINMVKQKVVMAHGVF